MDPQILKIIHIAGILLLFYAFGALSYGAAHSSPPKSMAGRRFYSALHGFALLVILVTGLGQMHALRTGFPHWIAVKFVVWLLLGGSVALVMRKPAVDQRWRNWTWVLLIGLAAIAVTAAILHPTF